MINVIGQSCSSIIKFFKCLQKSGILFLLQLVVMSSHVRSSIFLQGMYMRFGTYYKGNPRKLRYNPFRYTVTEWILPGPTRMYIGKKRRLSQSCASAQSRMSLNFLYTQRMVRSSHTSSKLDSLRICDI